MGVTLYLENQHGSNSSQPLQISTDQMRTCKSLQSHSLLALTFEFSIRGCEDSDKSGELLSVSPSRSYPPRVCINPVESRADSPRLGIAVSLKSSRRRSRRMAYYQDLRFLFVFIVTSYCCPITSVRMNASAKHHCLTIRMCKVKGILAGNAGELIFDEVY